MTSGAPLLEMRSISKSFGSIRALDQVDFEVGHGEVMALVGENGAGKSTLVKILAGMYAPDSGEIELAGRAVEFSGASQSEHAGIAVVQQELSLVPTLSIADNIFLGDTKRGWNTAPRVLALAAMPFLAQVGLENLDPRGRVERLTVAERQLIEVARLLARDARVLIFDEPTAALADREIERGEIGGAVPSVSGALDHLRDPPARRGLRPGGPGHGVPGRAFQPSGVHRGTSRSTR